MVNFSGQVLDFVDACDEYARIVAQFRQPYGLAPAPLSDDVLGTSASGGAGGIGTGTARVAGQVRRQVTPGFDWFGRFHLTPRGGVNFGNVVTTVQEDFDLFNASDVAVNLTTITNNAGAGISVVNSPSLPHSIPAFTSLLDPATTRLVPVLQRIQADKNGAPVFNGDIEFTMSDGEVLDLLLRGVRIVFFLVEPENPFTERLQFQTDILEHIDGSEQRVAARANYRQFYDYSILLDAEDRQRMQHLLFGWQPSVFAIPLWHERVLTTLPAGTGNTSLTVSSTDDSDFRVGGLAVIYESPTKYDVLQVDSVTTNGIQFTASPLLHLYDSGAMVMPVRSAILLKNPSGARYLNVLEAFTATFQVVDNHTGTAAGDTSSWDTYNGKVLLDDANVVQGDTMSETFEQKVYVVDGDLGAVQSLSRWDTNRRQHRKGFLAQSRAQAKKIRQLLVALQGRQKTFYIPTFAEDLTVSATMLSASVTMDVVNVGYTRFVEQRPNKSIVRLTFTDGTQLVRVVQSSVEVDESTERLSLNTGWPSTRTAAEVVRVEYFELCRFMSDEFAIQYENVATARLVSQVVAVPV